MPSSKASLDLEAWANFLPPERSNDFEYNFLLYKFRAFYNEVKEFHELHTNCPVTRATLASNSELPVFGSPVKNSSNCLTTQSLNSNNNTNNHHVSGKPTIATKPFNSTQNGSFQKQQQVANQNKKPIFQQQNSFPSIGGSSSGPRDSLFKQHYRNHLSPKQSSNHDTVNNSVQQLYNSSYNLSSTNTNYHNNVQSSASRPEIRQRNQVAKSRLLLSKSSERLDTINNNHLPTITSSKTQHDLNTFESSKSTIPVVNNDSKFMESDGNIYDAVSPDDLANDGGGTGHVNVATSIYNLNKLSMSQRSKLESSKSSLGLGSSAETNKGKFITNTKGIPNRNPNESSLNSSVALGQINHSSSSLSLSNGNQSSKDMDSPNFANYVNIDFFLKRNDSPSFKDFEEDATNDDEDDTSSDSDTTQMSNSLSSDRLCDDTSRDMLTSNASNKFLNQANNSSSTSVTPASSGDFLDDPRTSSMMIQSSQTKRTDPTSNRLASFFSNESPITKDFNTKNTSPQQTLGSILENATKLASAKQSSSFDPSQMDKDGNAFAEAQNTMRTFLSDLNLSPVDDVFEDKAQRRIVKESFAVEFCGRRKLRHLFLFNDVIVCAKYQASSKQKFTFDVKWYLNLNGVSILDMSDVSNQVKYDREAIESQILSIRTSLMLLRGQIRHIKRGKQKQPSKMVKKLKKKRTELEAELVLLLPHLPLVIKHLNGKKYTFFLSSNFDRNQWIESIKFLQSQLPSSKVSSSASPSSSELQAWIQTCRKNLNPSLGTFLLRSNSDEDLLYGDLYINLNALNGILKPGHYYFCFEVDSYGHFSQKASSAVLFVEKSEHELNEEYIFPLDGAHTLRILLYEDVGSNSKPSVIGKAYIELSRSWLLDEPIEKSLTFNSNCSLKTQLSYSSSELLSMRIPHAKLCPTFGMDITQVCKKEKTNVPLIIQFCVNEVERRGMREVGIYRMSGTSTDIQRLKKAFETNPYVAELLLRDIDINSVTGFLKTYLREMPEGLFSNKLYSKFVAAFNMPQTDSIERTKKMLDLFHMIPLTNQHTIIYLVEHLVKVNKYEIQNKMSLTNLATVLGPNILKPPTESSGTDSADPFTAVVIGSMSQAGILYFFLNRKFSNLPLTELDPSELNRNPGS